MEIKGALAREINRVEWVSDEIAVSVVIPIFNEANTIETLHHRLTRTLAGIGEPYEVIYVDDGSNDGSEGVLKELHRKDPKVTVLRFNRNYGQHAAVIAGFERAKGNVIVTLDGDLQNPPEEIPKLLAKIEEGYDVVGGWREERQDSWFRKSLSFLINRVTSLIIGVQMKDYGCMLRAYRRSVVERVCQCQEAASFIPALANAYAGSVAEIPVSHSARETGRSKYGLFRLMRLNFDLLTGFSLLPIQVVSFAGILISFLGLSFGAFLLIRRLLVGPEVEGVFTLFAILFFFVGLQVLALGLIGEYVGRIYMEVRRRPRYIVKEVLCAGDGQIANSE